MSDASDMNTELLEAIETALAEKQLNARNVADDFKRR
jgi:hypothetical protein